MSSNPLFRPSKSPTNTTAPSKAVNSTPTSVKLTHNTFDNSYFNFKTQRFGQYEPFWHKKCVPGDQVPYANSHNVRSLPFASPILSPMKLNKDYFMVPNHAIQPNTWEYIFKNPTQGDDVPLDAHNIFPLSYISSSSPVTLPALFSSLVNTALTTPSSDNLSKLVLAFVAFEGIFSSGGLLSQLNVKLPLSFGDGISFDDAFDRIFDLNIGVTVSFDSGEDTLVYSFANTSDFDEEDLDGPIIQVSSYELASIIRSHFFNITNIVAEDVNYILDFDITGPGLDTFVDLESFGSNPVSSIDMATVVAYKMACFQYYVNPRVDFLYNAQLFRDNWFMLLRQAWLTQSSVDYNIVTFDYNGLPVVYDYFSLRYYNTLLSTLNSFVNTFSSQSIFSAIKVLGCFHYLFSFEQQLRFGDYFVDSRTQALGYGEPGSDVINVLDDAVSVTDISQSLVLNRFRSAVAHLDNSEEEYLSTMFHEQLPPDFHYPKFIIHSEFGINGEEVSNTTSDNQGNIVTNLKSGADATEFNIPINIPCVLIGISYVSIPQVYTKATERHYFHKDRYDAFQPMLQYFGDQEVYRAELDFMIDNPAAPYAYMSRNAEYKQRFSVASGAFTKELRSWIMTIDGDEYGIQRYLPRLHQSSELIRHYDFEFNRFLKAVNGVSLGSGFHFIMQYNNINVENRPMEINPLPLYPSQKL